MTGSSTYASFVGRVALPGIRSLLVFLAVLAIAFGSWLETHNGQDCDFRNSMSIQQVTLLRNMSAHNVTSPNSIAFGLWRHCFFYNTNCTCVPLRLNYELDAPVIFQAAMNNEAIPTTTGSTYIRVVPLMIATVLIVVALLFGFYANRQVKQQYHWGTAGLVLVCTVLVVIAFGTTYRQYSGNIKSTCRQMGDICMETEFGVEFILLIMGIGLSFLGSVFWAIRPPSENQQKRKRRKKTSSGHLDATKSTNTPMTYESHDPLAAWRDAAMLENHSPDTWPTYNNPEPYYDMQPNRTKVLRNSLAPPPLAKQQSHKHRYSYNTVTPHQNSHRRRSEGDFEDLVPPTLPYAAHRASHGSGNTFGANSPNRFHRHSHGSSVTLDEYSPQHTPRPLNTPQGDYFCMTPLGNPSGTSNSSGDHSPVSSRRRRSSSGILAELQRRHSNSPVDVVAQPRDRKISAPTSGIATPGSSPNRESDLHPLNRKVITDQRISEYLKRQSPQP